MMVNKRETMNTAITMPAKGSQETGGPVWTSPVWMDKNVKNTVMGSPMAKGRETAAINVIHNLKFFIR